MNTALRRWPLRDPAFWLASGLGSGLAPRAPGTFGTLAALLPWLWLRGLPWPAYLGITLLTFLAGTWAAERVIRASRIDDPGVVVIDEWVGLWLCLFAAPVGWTWMLGGFLLFRLFDIWKPWPVRWADRELHGGFGTMLDDALAGVMAWLILQLAALVLAP